MSDTLTKERLDRLIGNTIEGSILGSLGAFRLIEDPRLTVTRTIPRTLRERWLTRPWRPLQRVRFETVPSNCLFRCGHALIGHPEMIKQIKEISICATPRPV